MKSFCVCLSAVDDLQSINQSIIMLLLAPCITRSLSAQPGEEVMLISTVTIINITTTGIAILNPKNQSQPFSS